MYEGLVFNPPGTLAAFAPLGLLGRIGIGSGLGVLFAVVVWHPDVCLVGDTAASYAY